MIAVSFPLFTWFYTINFSLFYFIDEKSAPINVLNYAPRHTNAKATNASSSKGLQTTQLVSSAKFTKTENIPDDNGLVEVYKMIGVFKQIKNSRKPVTPCSLFPFYRSILLQSIPLLLKSKQSTSLDTRNEITLSKPSINFDTSTSYSKAFRPLLIEECKAELEEGLNSTFGSNNSHASKESHKLRYMSEQQREGMRCLTFCLLSDNSNSSQNWRRGKLPFRNHDVLLFRPSQHSRSRNKVCHSFLFYFMFIIFMNSFHAELRRIWWICWCFYY